MPFASIIIVDVFSGKNGRPSKYSMQLLRLSVGCLIAPLLAFHFVGVFELVLRDTPDSS
jgi:hypothetical protein